MKLNVESFGVKWTVCGFRCIKTKKRGENCLSRNGFVDNPSICNFFVNACSFRCALKLFLGWHLMGLRTDNEKEVDAREEEGRK